MTSYLITGTVRGLGLEIVRQLSAQPLSSVSLIFATARDPSSPALDDLQSGDSRIKLVRLDVVDPASADAAVKEVEAIIPNGAGLDVLINNAGIIPYTPNGIKQMTDFEEVFRINVFSAHAVTTAFLPLLEQGKAKTVVNTSTTLGSLGMSARYAHFPSPAYKVSKAALNMLTVQYALEYKEKGFAFVTISPGWVQTDLGSVQADLKPADSVKSFLKITNRAIEDKANNARFFNVLVPGWEEKPGLNQYDGKEPVW